MIDVAIIGAGAAGVGAARTLAGTGRSVLVIEAGDRVGGRARTEMLDAMPLDLGCGWLHSADRNPWVAIAGQAGMTIDRTPSAWGEQYRELGFSKRDQASAAHAFAAFDRRLRADPPASDCAADALIPGDAWNGHLDALSGYINGVGLRALSVRDYLAYDDAATDANWRLPAGYGALVARSLPPVPVRFGTSVRAIVTDGAALRLTTDAGDIDAAAAIVTVPTTVIARGLLRLPARLDGHAHAAAHLPLGLANKLFLRLPDDHGLEADRHLIGHPHRAITGSYYLCPFGRPIIECFFGGEGAAEIEATGLDGAVRFARDELQPLLGRALTDRLTLLAGSCWGRADGFGGSYSHALPGHADARAQLAEPWQDRLCFAGEACSPTDFSTAHGALDTGIAAARFLLSRRQR